MGKLQELYQNGQSIWYDYIRRSFIASGGLQEVIDQGVRGVTSNPSIFEKAIAGSTDYDEALRSLAKEGNSVEEIYETLVLDDIREAADVLRPVYNASDGADGFVSLEVSPKLAHDTEGTVEQARRLHHLLARPNVMIKVPATRAGIPALEQLISEGINVNVTLIFSITHYRATARAYLAGLEKRAAAGGDLSDITSVASFFISRVDTAVDNELKKLGSAKALALSGHVAIDNAKVAYALFREIFCGARWDTLASHGARVQRPLWASTGTKNPIYSDTRYIDRLIATDTVNTAPPHTLQAFRDHGKVEPTLSEGLDEAHARLRTLAQMDVDLDAITDQLQDDGVVSFARAFETLLASIHEKQSQLQSGRQPFTTHLGKYQEQIKAALAKLKKDRIMNRIWAHDYMVWKPEPTEITNRLGWLHSPTVMDGQVKRLRSFTNTLLTEGYTSAVLLGMGGSSLAPTVFKKTFGSREGYLNLAILDSTDPATVSSIVEQFDPFRTLFIVATKSGGTVETLSFFKYFYNHVARTVGMDRAGEHFIAITDPGSNLVSIADRYHFRETFLNDPNIGGRYSAISHFGLVPAALLGIELENLLDAAKTMACNCDGCNCPVGGNNYGGQLGVAMGKLALAGRDKITLITSSTLDSFGDWVEQLIAESTGKEGTGILPVIGEPVGSPKKYGDDRLFVYLRLDGESMHDAAVEALEAAGHPVIRMRLRNLDELGGQFFLWEMATTVAGHLLGINPFDQPNVESAKQLAREMVRAYKDNGALPEDYPSPLTNDSLAQFLVQARAGDYIALHAYVAPTAETDEALRLLRTRLRDNTRLAVTVGYGPRFLHSTGQLHKGDGGNGLFIQFSSDNTQDIPVPEEAGGDASSITFGKLEMAATLGDKQALLDAGRRVIRFHLGADVPAGIMSLAPESVKTPSFVSDTAH